MRLDVELVTSQGVVHCTLKRTVYEREPAIEADMYRSGEFLLSDFTLFRAAVYMRWNGYRYIIIQPGKDGYTNAYWRELENLISNTIIVNE